MSKFINTEKAFRFNINVIKTNGNIEDKDFYVEGYASTADLDRHGEVITLEALEGAAQALVDINNTAFFGHEYNLSNAVGRIDQTKVDDIGLWIKIYVSSWAKELRTKLKEGVISKFSIGGRVLKDRELSKAQAVEAGLVTTECPFDFITVIDAIELFEVSFVGIPANPHAQVAGTFAKALQSVYARDRKVVNSLKNLEKREVYKSSRGDIISRFLNVDPLKQKVLSKGYGYFKLAVVAKALDVLARQGYTIAKTFNVEYGQLVRPVFAHLETGRDKKEELLVDGFYCIYKDDVKLVVGLTPSWHSFYLSIYSLDEDNGNAKSFLETLEKWCADNNFLKGEKITPKGKFLKLHPQTFVDLKLPEDKKKAIKVGALEFFKKKDIYTKNNIPFKRGLIFAGEPGTGKTLTGKVLASSTDATFIWVTADYFDRYSDSTDFKMLLDMAKELAPSILFAEDIDDYLKISGAIDAIKGQMDGLDSLDGVVTILCTNYPEQIPAALIDRPSRFDDVVMFELPNETLRYEILDQHAKNLEIDNREEVLKKIAKDSDSLTGAHLKEVIIYSCLLASDEDRDTIIEKDLIKALTKVKATKELVRNLNDKKKYVQGIRVKSIPLVQKKKEGGVSMPKPNQGESKQDFINRCVSELVSEEGKDQDQAVAMCSAIWEEAQKDEQPEPVAGESNPATPEEPVEEPTATKAMVMCPDCGWKGSEEELVDGKCPECGKEVVPMDEPEEEPKEEGASKDAEGNEPLKIVCEACQTEIPLEAETDAVKCPGCGAVLNSEGKAYEEPQNPEPEDEPKKASVSSEDFDAFKQAVSDRLDAIEKAISAISGIFSEDKLEELKTLIQEKVKSIEVYAAKKKAVIKKDKPQDPEKDISPEDEKEMIETACDILFSKVVKRNKNLD